MNINAAKFDKVARTVFKPIYPLIAQQIVGHTGLRRGCCLDLGCGGGYLGLEVARLTDMDLIFLDQSADMLAIVQANLAERGLTERGRVILSDVENIPLPDASVDLAISRGSVFFWEDLAAAFGHIWRVLAPGGRSYIGGGFGSAALRESIVAQMREKDPQGAAFRDKVKRNLGPRTRRKFSQALSEAGVTDYDMVDNEEEGLWLVMRKGH